MIKVAMRCRHCNNIRWVDAEGFCNRCTPEVRRQPRERRHSTKPGKEPRWKANCANCGRMRKSWVDPSTRRRPMICGVCRSGRNTDGEPDRPVPPEPTNASPGSEEKKRVMRQRAAAGYAIFHPHDSLYRITTPHCVSGSEELDVIL